MIAQCNSAADLQVGPADPAGQGGALPQVAFGVLKPQRPRLDGPQVQQRHRAQVAAQRDVVVGRPGDRRGEEAGLLDDAGQVAAAPGQPQPQRRDRHPEAAPATWWRRLGVRLGDRQVGGRLVQVPVEQVIRGVHQGQLRVIRGGALREGPQQRLDGLRLPVEGQAERMVGQQPGRVGPVARRLGVPDAVGNLAVLGEPAGGAPVQRGYLFGPRAAQLQPQQIPEQVVVAKPRPPGVQRDHERVGVFETQQGPFRARVAGQQVGQFAVDAIEQAGAQQQLLDVVGLAVQQLGEQVLGDRAVAAGELGDEPLRVGVSCQ